MKCAAKGNLAQRRRPAPKLWDEQVSRPPAGTSTKLFILQITRCMRHRLKVLVPRNVGAMVRSRAAANPYTCGVGAVGGRAGVTGDELFGRRQRPSCGFNFGARTTGSFARPRWVPPAAGLARENFCCTLSPHAAPHHSIAEDGIFGTRVVPGTSPSISKMPQQSRRECCFETRTSKNPSKS
jgi:hypothetical protein